MRYIVNLLNFSNELRYNSHDTNKVERG